jgi:hypothetical protein
MTDTPMTSTIQVNAALEYLKKGSGFWRLDIKSCKFYARLAERVRK